MGNENKETPGFDLTGYLTDIKAKVDGIDTKAALMDSQLAEIIKGKDAKEVPVAELSESGILENVMKFEVAHIPVGQAAGGGFVAVLATELIDGFMSKMDVKARGAVKIIGAGASAMYGKKILGSTGSKVVALLLTFDALRDLTPIDAWAAKAASMVTGVLPMWGLADKSNRRGNAVNQASKVANDYYAKAFGR